MDSNQILELINRRERQMLVHSYLYYEMDVNIWSDHEFNEKAVELAELLRKHPYEARLAEWCVSFDGWDGSTGSHLPLKHPDVINTATKVWRYYNKGVV